MAADLTSLLLNKLCLVLSLMDDKPIANFGFNIS